MLKMLPKSGHPMDALSAAVAAMGMFYPGDHVHDPKFRRECVVRLVANFPTVVAAWQRIRNGDDPIRARPDLGHAANFLYMLSGDEPAPLLARTMDVALILHAEHQMNASTFSARVTGSALADPYAVVSAAVGTLSGPLHGGANEEVLKMLRTIPSKKPSIVRAWAEDRLARKEKISGFGHREYKVKDPRATILQKLSQSVFEQYGTTPVYDIATELERQMADLVGGKGIYPNVDFYSGILYEKLGIPTDLFTPIFAIARVSGWLAHLLEQLQNNRIFRPSQVWTGQADREFVAMDKR
jgi:citrate synthase